MSLRAARRMVRLERGVSLVEATIILMVIATLTAMIAPSVTNYLQDARNITAKKDVETIGSGVLQLLKDTGSRCLRINGANDCTVTNRVDLLISGGSDPGSVSAADVSLADADSATTVAGAGAVNWLPSTNAPTQTDTIDEQLIVNTTTPYTAVGFTGGGGPRTKIGWRGAYLTGTVSSDPWGRKYQADTMFLAVATNAFDGAGVPDQSQEGLREAGWKRDVLVLSAGGNGMVETSFGEAAAAGVLAKGDDVIYVLGGTTR